MMLSPVSSAAYLRLCVLSALSVMAMQASAATDTTTEDQPTAEFDAIVVTASRTPTKVENTIAQTRVIDEEALQRYQGQSALDVLKRQPGVTFKQNGGLGTVSNFYMRGYDNRQILVLIDGVRYSSVSLGGAALNLLPADQIERIEVIYGASGSSIYGSDAMGGVIQIFTKGSNVYSNNFSVTAGAGSHDHYTYGANAQVTNGEGTTFSLGASHNETKGINATLPNVDNISGYRVYNNDNDGFESDNFSFALNHRFGDQVLMGTSGLYSKSTSEYDDGDYDNARTEQENGALQAYVDWQYMPDAAVKLQYGRSVDKSESFASYPSVFDSTQDQVTLVGKNKLAMGQGVYGLEYLTQSLDSTGYSIDDRDVKSAFAGYITANDRFDAQANVRYDDDSRYDDETTYNLGAAVHLSPDFRIGTSYAKGFRAPSFNELSPVYGGDLNLRPETSDNYEVFAQYNGQYERMSHNTRLTGYRNDVDDLIAYSNFQAKNINEAKIEGVSLTSDWEMNDYLFGGSYDYQQAKDNSGGSNDDNFLPFRPEHQGLVYVGYRLPSLDVRAEYEYVGDYYSNVGNTEASKVEHYGLLNISGNYELSDNLSMSARLNNVTNEKYVTIPGYNTDGTNFFTSLTYNWY